MPIRDFDPSEWDLPPLDVAALPTEPPPERDEFCGVVLGSELSEFSSVGLGIPVDLGAQVHDDLAAVRPGLAELARVGSTDFGVLDEVERVDALLAIEKQRAWLDSLQQQLLALISVRDSSAEHWCVEEIGAALRLSGQVAQAKLKNAEQLCGRLPATFDALADGQIAVLQATAITEASFELDDALLPRYEARVLTRAPEQSLSQLKQSAKRAVTSLNPTTAEAKRQKALHDRHVRLAPAENGMAWLTSLLPAADAKAIYARIDGAARMASRTDPRSADELRADALVNGILNGIQGELPTAHGRQPRVSVVIGLDSLVGKDNEPGWLDGYGAITAAYAREIAHDPTGTWRRLVTDPVSGQLLDHGTTRYRPPQQLADHVIARDGECTFPFCAHSAAHADLDHIDEFPQGPTSAGNLQPLHRRHHNSKTHGGWKADRNPATGNTVWTSPQGRTYPSRPPDRWGNPGYWSTPESPPAAEPDGADRQSHDSHDALRYDDALPYREVRSVDNPYDDVPFVDEWYDDDGHLDEH